MDNEHSLIRAVHVITRLLSSTLDTDEAIRQTLAVAIEATEAEGGSVLLYEEPAGVLRFRHVVGGRGDQLVGFALSEDEGIVGQVFTSGQAQICNNLAESGCYSPQVDETFHFETRNTCTVPLCYAGGRPVGVLQLVNKREGGFVDSDLSVLDIVASVAAMNILNADLAREAQRAAALTCLGDLAHDIKNKLAPVIMGSQTLDLLLEDVLHGDAACDQALAADISDSLQAVSDGAAEVQRYTKFIADASKGRSIEATMEAGDLAEVVLRQVASLMPAARQLGVELACEVVDKPVLPFDQFLIERAVYNLVNNAIPETPAGGRITVRVWLDSPNVAIEVADTGRGMPQHVLESILSGRAISTKPGGTGLGTSIVKKMIEAQGGRFEGESTEGAGTRLRLVLPSDSDSV